MDLIINISKHSQFDELVKTKSKFLRKMILSREEFELNKK